MARSTPAQKPRGLARSTSIDRAKLASARFSHGRPPRVGGVERGFQLRMRAPQLVDDLPGPFEVLPAALFVPAHWRAAGKGAAGAELFGPLDQLRPPGGNGSVLDLQALARGL